MSRRRPEGRPERPEVIIECRACDESEMVARFYVDADGDPVLKAREGLTTFSFVEPFELIDGRMVPSRSDEERRIARKATVVCADGHTIPLLTSTLFEYLSAGRDRVAL